ncbi:DNA polymerase III subunit beta [Candidatus Uhrbacteria bacterium]|jgi:DNA polymerase III subunit beta|nr:DNA polymerase III subunit beta [Candidatus Uhrbacteria bacterium]
MKLSCTKDNLHQGLSITSHLMTKNVNLPILQNVLVKAEGGSIRFTSTNLEMAVNCTVRGKVEEPGEYTIPSKLFFDYVSLLPNETIHIDTSDSNVKVECGSYNTQINGLSATEFPLVPKVEGERTFQIPVDAFKEALSQTLFSVAANESRPELTGVVFNFFVFEGEGRVTLASTDSYRLSEKTIPVVSGVTDPFGVVIPAKSLSEINRILSVFKDTVDLPSSLGMTLTNSQVVFTYGPVELISRTIEENYPDYKQIIPTQFQTQAIIDRTDFIKAVKTASLFSRIGLFDVALTLDPETKTISVSATDATRGKNTTQCSADITGVKNSVTVNFRYLLDGLNAIKADQIVFEMIDASNPCLVTPKGETSAYRYVVMPIKQ